MQSPLNSDDASSLYPATVLFMAGLAIGSTASRHAILIIFTIERARPCLILSEKTGVGSETNIVRRISRVLCQGHALSERARELKKGLPGMGLARMGLGVGAGWRIWLMVTSLRKRTLLAE